MSLNFQRTRDLLYNFQFSDLFIEELGWSKPSRQKPVTLKIENKSYLYQKIAELSGVAIFEITAKDGKIPDAKARVDIHKEITKLIAENLLIFITQERTRSLWYWVKREGSKSFVRDHLYVKGQPGDLFLSKLGSLVIDITELEHGEPTVVEIAYKLQRGFDVEPVTKKFYKEFQEQHQKFLLFVQGIDNETDRRWYTSVILNRLMFVYFLQRKGFIDNKDLNYLQNKLELSKQKGDNYFYSEFLKALFFESFAKPEIDRDLSVQELVGKVKYLNGGLFLKHHIEDKYDISIVDEAFEQVLDLFERYSWNLDDTPEGKDDEINPDVLGYIFEKYINQKAFGAYYTRPQITEYLCDRTIHKLIVDRVNDTLSDKYKPFEDINELLIKLDTNVCHLLMEDILPNLSILDPACGSGAFLVAAMKTLIQVYSAVIGTIQLMGNCSLKKTLEDIQSSHPSVLYFIKKRIVSDNLYGIDIMAEATEIAKLRLFLALVSSAHDVEELEPLPNIDFNIMAGNSLIGLIKVDDTAFDAVGNSLQGNLLQSLAADKYQKILEEKNKSVELYKKHAFLSKELPDTDTPQEIRLIHIRTNIEELNNKSQEKLNVLLLDEFSKRLGIKYEEVQLTGKSLKRVLKVEDIAALKPFHWGYHFDKVLERGGFDAIITNPPWEVFKPNAKEFFAHYNDLVTKKKMDIHAFEQEQEKLLKDLEIAAAWLDYQKQFPYISDYYRLSEQYKNQVPIINGKKVGTDINLYKIFLEQCFNLLSPGGECGIVVPSGIYTDLGAKKLREMLFNQTQISGLFCFENRKEIFEGVHRSFKFVVLTFEKGSKTEEFPASFMRHDVQELQNFPNDESFSISVELVRRFSPDSMSIMEFRSREDLDITEKLLSYPLLSDSHLGWGLELYGEELHMTRSKKYFQQSATKYALYEGGMIWHFKHDYDKPHYWIKESDLREVFLHKRAKRIGFNGKVTEDLKNDYEVYRLAIRKIASNTNERTLISTVIPAWSFAGNSLTVNFPFHHNTDRYNDLRISNSELLVLSSLLNTFVVDYTLRSRMTTNLNSFYLYQLPVPRLTKNDRYFNDIVQRAAKLICTTPEFDELAQEVGLVSHQQGVTDETERAKLRAELDGMIAHLYGLTEDEFSYILTTFPIVNATVKEAALSAFRSFAPMFGDSEILASI
ncbi:Eco57I restriction-modification methylase domain-containing protein [Nostoc sp. JL33]|uniref:Eco57I restriction-modification methylase domain-containing protein n=1 Tax=Nostoc sp. JL33 TaxID=2815396 RepID=UPI0025F6A843|nr:DNA methyltransferase [Nostoc sp. JL33]MBN3869968.1 ATP-binding protein [Nostoc sp. JL33]